MKLYLSILIIVFTISCKQNKSQATEAPITNIDEGRWGQDIQSVELEKSENENIFTPPSIDSILKLNNKIQLRIKNTDSINIPEYFIDNVTIDSLIKPHNNRHIESLEIEKYIIQKDKEIAKRDSSGLHVKLKNGEWKLLSIDPMTDESDNTLEHFFKDHGFYNIRVQWGEGNGYKLVNYKSGVVTKLKGKPFFSPNGEYIIAVNADVVAGYSYNGFQLLGNKDGIIKEIGKFEPMEWGPLSVKWIDNNNLTVKNHTFAPDNTDGNDFPEFYTEISIKTVANKTYK